jgi:hypothetical protein
VPLTQGTLLELLNSAARKERADFAEEVWELMTACVRLSWNRIPINIPLPPFFFVREGRERE